MLARNPAEHRFRYRRQQPPPSRDVCFLCGEPECFAVRGHRRNRRPARSRLGPREHVPPSVIVAVPQTPRTAVLRQKMCQGCVRNQQLESTFGREHAPRPVAERGEVLGDIDPELVQRRRIVLRDLAEQQFRPVLLRPTGSVQQTQPQPSSSVSRMERLGGLLQRLRVGLQQHS